MKIERRGLDAREYVGKFEEVIINGDICPSEKTNKAGKNYNVYSLPIELAGGKKGLITGVFMSGFEDIATYYGDESREWIGKKITITAVQTEDKKNVNWKLFPPAV